MTYLITIESNISSAPARRLFANTGGIERDSDAFTTVNSPSALALPLSFTASFNFVLSLLFSFATFSFPALSVFERFEDGSSCASTCLRFFVFSSEVLVYAMCRSQ